VRKAESKSKKTDSMRNPEYVNIKRAPAKERLTDKMRARLNVLLGNAKQSIMDYKRDRLKHSLPISIDELGDKTPQEWREHLNRYPDNKVRPDEFLRMHDWEWNKLKQKEKEYLESLRMESDKSKEESSPRESRPNKKPATSTAKRMSSVYKAMATKPVARRNKYM
jgi:MoaA/NifB/PqqE/SkfB family radical SAM enzyme